MNVNESSSDYGAGPRSIAILTFLSLIAMIAVNALANALPLNGVNTGQLSDEIPNLFVPAGLTFAVWGVIYVLSIGYAATVLRTAFRKRSTMPWTSADGLLFICNALANSAWIFAWHWRLIPLSMVLMLVILGTLIALEERNFHRFLAGGALAAGSHSPGSIRFFLTAPINVYLGWICVATIANLTALLVVLGWDGFGLSPVVWTVAVIIAGFAVALLLALRRKAIEASLVVVWAYLGIVLKRTSVDPDATRPIWISAAAAGIVILVVLGIMAYHRVFDIKTKTS